jgi:hypothetical protein
MDITETIAPKSDQLNAEDLLTGPRTVTVAEVRRGSAEQPVEIVTEEFGPGRPFKPSKTCRRVLVAAWGAEASAYVGRRMTLYRDPSIKFGGMDVGGIRISHMSHIAKKMTLALTVTRGKRAPSIVEPLPDNPTPPPVDGLQADLKRMYTLIGDAGLARPPEKALEFISKAVGRTVESSKSLTRDEIGMVFAALEEAGA